MAEGVPMAALQRSDRLSFVRGMPRSRESQPTVYRTLGSAEISVQHGPYGFRFGQLMFCRGVATEFYWGVMNHGQCGQQTPQIPPKLEKLRI